MSSSASSEPHISLAFATLAALRLGAVGVSGVTSMLISGVGEDIQASSFLKELFFDTLEMLVENVNRFFRSLLRLF